MTMSVGNKADVVMTSPAATQTPSIKFHLERESSSMSTLFLLATTSVNLEVARQVCSYAIRYYNNDTYPAPSTLLVFIAEFFKFLIFFVRLLATNRLGSISFSFAYLVPSTLYALNNNIYFVALCFTSPPVWNLLMQSRVVFTAAVYRFHFRKVISRAQWFALMVLTIAIMLLQFSGRAQQHSPGGSTEEPDSTVSWDFMIALGLAVVASMFAAVGPVYTEYLLKHDVRSFEEKQLQMYLFGTLVTGSLFLMERFYKSDDFTPIIVLYGNPQLLMALLVTCITVTVCSGIVVAVIIKKLDNIVKLYTQAISNTFTAFACILLFPKAFSFDAVFVISLALTLVAIYLYETKSLPCKTKLKDDNPT